MTIIPPTVLTVDADPAVLKMLRSILEAEGYRVLEAASPGEALILLGTFKVDVLVSDSDIGPDPHIPAMSGTALATLIAGNQPATRIILMSGGGRIEHEPGRPWWFIQKPFPLDAFLGMVARALAS